MSELPRLNLVLAGPMGSGKTTIARILAAHLDLPWNDLDHLIVAREGKSIPELFAAGESVFRAAEARAVRSWIQKYPDRSPEILALGGGTLEDPELAELLARKGVIVHLDAPADVLLRRLDQAGLAGRPLLAGNGDPGAELERLRQRRAAGYSRADFTQSTATLPAAAVAVAVLRRLYESHSGPWRQDPRPIANEGSVTQSRGGLPFPAQGTVVLLRDRRLPALHFESLHRRIQAAAVERLVVLERAGGEAAKRPESLLAAWQELAAAGIDRDAAFWTVGGGTLSDLGGLVAHTFKRGLPLFLLPTTLLAQLDAAVGGKNGINFAGAKNIIGTTRLPDAVHLDALFLLTLGDLDLRGGLAEAVKSGLIGDMGLFELIERRGRDFGRRPLPLLEEVTARAAAVKLSIVGGDLQERGERRLLNLGHTLGHALEAATQGGAAPLSHGEAVAIGMIFALRLSRRLGVLEDPLLPERVAAALTSLGLPVAPPALGAGERAALFQALLQDKKRRAAASLWVLVRRSGRCVVRPVERSDWEAEWEDFGR